MKNKNIALFGMLIALCFVLSYIERIIPINVGIPGVKLGLSNIVVLFALYTMSVKSAFIISIIRIVIQGMLFSNPITFSYSVAGGILSYIVMIVFKRVQSLSIYSVSVAGGISHNIAQIFVAYIFLGSGKVVAYLPILIISAVVSGVITGGIASIVVERVGKGLK